MGQCCKSFDNFQKYFSQFCFLPEPCYQRKHRQDLQAAQALLAGLLRHLLDNFINYFVFLFVCDASGKYFFALNQI